MRTVTIFEGYGIMAHMPYEKYVFHFKSGRKVQDDRHALLQLKAQTVTEFGGLGHFFSYKMITELTKWLGRKV